MASLPSSHAGAAAPPPDDTLAPAGGLPSTREQSKEPSKAGSPGPGSSADSYNDEDTEKRLGYEKEVGLSPDDVGALEGGGKDAKKKESFWRKKRELNPLRWQPIPPVPEKQSISAEANAGFFSKLTLSWIGPLMRVCRHLWLSICGSGQLLTSITGWVSTTSRTYRYPSCRTGKVCRGNNCEAASFVRQATSQR